MTNTRWHWRPRNKLGSYKADDKERDIRLRVGLQVWYEGTQKFYYEVTFNGPPKRIVWREADSLEGAMMAAELEATAAAG